MKHSDVIGGSNADRVIACPGSVALCKQVPKQEESEFMAEGSMLHEVIEMLVQSDETEPSSLVGYQAYGQTLTSDHLVECILPALAELERVMDLYGIHSFDTEVEASWESEIPGAFGSIDLIGLGKVNLIWDWKFGRGVPVSAVDNGQGLFYAAGAWLSDSLSDMFDPELPTVIAICQPRLSTTASLHQVETTDLVQFINQAKVAVRKSQQPDAPISAGKHCRWCQAKPICPLKAETAHRIQRENKSLGDLGDLGELLPLADEMADWAKSVRGAAITALEGGAEIEGYKLVAKRGIRKWYDEVEAARKLRNRRYKVADTHEKKLKSPAQIEKLAKLLGKNLDLSELAGSSSSGVNLAPDSHPSPAVLPMGKLKTLGEKYE